MHICQMEQVAVFPAPSLGRHKGGATQSKDKHICGCVFCLDILAWHKRLEVPMLKGAHLM